MRFYILKKGLLITLMLLTRILLTRMLLTRILLTQYLQYFKIQYLKGCAPRFRSLPPSASWSEAFPCNTRSETSRSWTARRTESPAGGCPACCGSWCRTARFRARAGPRPCTCGTRAGTGSGPQLE